MAKPAVRIRENKDREQAERKRRRFTGISKRLLTDPPERPRP